MKSYNKCLSCEKPGYAPESYYCKNICGDGLIVNGLYGYYSEYCDDGNTSNTSRCNSDCSYCVYGYYLGQDKICNPRCGDKIKTIDEICESGNILPYKGCQNCLPKCQPTCLTCDIIFIFYITLYKWKWLYQMQSWLSKIRQCMSSYLWRFNSYRGRRL